MKLFVYRARDGWRWHLRARNGRIVAESGEAYTRKSDCITAALRLADAAHFAKLVVKEK